MAVKVTLVGDKSIIATYNRKIAQIKREKEYIFYEPLDPIVREIRQNLVTDTFNQTHNDVKHHIFTGDTFRNTLKKYTTRGNSGGYSMSIQFGYFSEHGEKLELGSDPHGEPIFKLEAWASAKEPKLSSAGQSALALKAQKKLRKTGGEPYPIIVPVWEKQQNKYFDEVKSRLEKVWNS